MCGPAFDPRFVFLWPNAKISVMGGEQASSVLADVRRDNAERSGSEWTEQEEIAFRNKIRQQYETQGNPYYASARLWDDGIINPIDTRVVLSHALMASRNAPIEATRFGVFRM